MPLKEVARGERKSGRETAFAVWLYMTDHGRGYWADELHVFYQREDAEYFGNDELRSDALAYSIFEIPGEPAQ